jgi:hypothetical protein
MVDDAGDIAGISAPSEGIESRLDNSPEILARLFDLLLNHALLNHAGSAEPYLLDRSKLLGAAVLTRDMELSIVAHEFGHVTQRSRSERSHRQVDEVGEFDESLWSWADEFSADVRGAFFVEQVLYLEGADLRRVLLAVEMPMLALSLSHRARSIAMTGADLYESGLVMSGTHPSAELRRKVLRDSMRVRLFEGMRPRTTVSDERLSVGVDQFFDMASVAAEIRDALWERCRPPFLEIYRRGSQIEN